MPSIEAFKRELSRKLYNYMRVRGKFKAGLLALWLYREMCQKNPVYREIWKNTPLMKRFSKVLLEELAFRGWIFYKGGYWIINAPPPVEELENILKHYFKRER